jgi:hypothetical protein
MDEQVCRALDYLIQNKLMFAGGYTLEAGQRCKGAHGVVQMARISHLQVPLCHTLFTSLRCAHSMAVSVHSMAMSVHSMAMSACEPSRPAMRQTRRQAVAHEPQLCAVSAVCSRMHATCTLHLRAPAVRCHRQPARDAAEHLSPWCSPTPCTILAPHACAGSGRHQGVHRPRRVCSRAGCVQPQQHRKHSGQATAVFQQCGWRRMHSPRLCVPSVHCHAEGAAAVRMDVLLPCRCRDQHAGGPLCTFCCVVPEPEPCMYGRMPAQVLDMTAMHA